MAQSNSPLYPLKFAPLSKEKVWGGRTLEKLGRTLPAAVPIGESWELADLGASSPGGGGGGPERSVIANGPLAGRTLHELIEQFGEQLLGRLGLTPGGEFPLLVKFVDARENLSVQVHPSPAYARAHPEAHLKSESFYIVAADPGAAIYKGVRPGVTADSFRRALTDSNPAAVEALLVKVPVKPGDCHYLPSGTCHAIGAGCLIAEVQTPSDTTFRVYDWGRPASAGRKLHIEEAMRCIDFDAPPEATHYEKRSHVAGMFTTVSRLITCEHFRIEKIRMSEGYEQEVPYDQPAVWIVLEGQGVIDPHNGAAAVEFSRGETLLIPAHMDDARLALKKDTVWLEITFPQAMAEQIA